MSQEKTEKPTAKRRHDARDKGQVARSRDLALAAASVAATIALAKLGGRLIVGLTNPCRRTSRTSAMRRSRRSRPVTSPSAINGALLIGLLVGPIAMATMVVGVGMHGFQGGWCSRRTR